MNADTRLKAASENELLLAVRDCTQCEHLRVCWLPTSIRGVLDAQESNAGARMFEWQKLGQICEQFTNAGKVFLDSSVEGDL